MIIQLLVLINIAHAGFGGSYSRGSGGGGSRSFSSPSRSYSAPSRSYSSPSRSFGGSYSRPSAPSPRPLSGFGGSYSTPKAPIVRPTPSPTPSEGRAYTPPARSQTFHSTEHHYHGGGGGGGGFFNGYLMGSLFNRPVQHHTTVVRGAQPVDQSGVIQQDNVTEYVEPRRTSVLGILFNLFVVGMIMWAVVFFWRKVM